MKVAIAILKDRISPVFDVSRNVLIIDIENETWTKEEVSSFENDNSMNKITKLLSLNIEVLVCGAISNALNDMVCLSGIRTIPFTCGQIGEVINALINDELPCEKYCMPGCCGFRNGGRAGGKNKTTGVAIMSQRKGKGAGGTPGRGKGRRGSQADTLYSNQQRTRAESGKGRKKGGKGRGLGNQGGQGGQQK